MSEFTIRRGERTFRATKLETVRELVRRGYLRAEDTVSVDGGPFGVVRGLPGLEDLELPPGGAGLAAASSTPPAGEPDATTSPLKTVTRARDEPPSSNVLDQFLSTLEEGRPVPAPRPPAPPQPDASEWLDRDEPPSLSDFESLHLETARAPAELVPIGGDALEPLPSSDRLVAIDGSALVPVEPAPAPSPAPPEAPRLRLIEPEPIPTSPPSFDKWVSHRTGEDGDLLSRFGEENDGIALRPRRARGANWFRTGGVVLIVASAIGLWNVWVRTVAMTEYPSEAELIEKQQGDGPGIPGAAQATTPGMAPSVLDEERRLRSRVVGEVPHFGSADELENALFQELSNLRVQPTSIEVEALVVQDAGTYDRQRPVEANVTVRLAGLPADTAPSLIPERVTLTWFVLARYSTLGRVSFRNVLVEFGPPSPYRQEREGSELLRVWNGRISAKDLIMEER